MKKTTKTVFARVLSLALVMALVLTSIVSSFAFTASAEDVKEFTGNYIDFENDGNVPDGMGLDMEGKYSIATSPTSDHGSYSLKKSYGTDNSTFRVYKKFEAGHTYAFNIEYYFVDETATYPGAYSPWFTVFVGTTGTKSLYKEVYGQWRSFYFTYTAESDANFFDIISNEITGYFDNIHVADITNKPETLEEKGSVLSDFTNIANQNELPLIPGSANSSVNFVYDSTIGKNVALVTIPANGSVTKENAVYVPYALKAGVSYSLDITYHAEDWACISYVDGKLDGGNAFDTESGYKTETMTFTPTADGRCLYISTTIAAGAKIKISSMFLKANKASSNTAEYQSYDFSDTTPVAGNGYSVQVVDGNNMALKLTHAASGNKDHIFKLDYALTAEKLYKVSFDYKGSIKARPYLFNSSDRWGTHQCVSIFGDSEIVFKSNDWARWETVVYAEYDHTGMDFLLVGTSVITDINTDYLYVDNFVIEEYTVGVDKYEEDFEDGTAFVGGCTQSVNDGVVADPLDSTNKVFYKAASSGNRQYYIMTPQLAAGHNYIVTFKAYAAKGDWTGFEKRGFGGTDQKGITGTGKWESYSYEFTPDWDEDYFCFNGKTAIYIDDFKIVDLTTDNDYYEDFSNPDDITLIKNSNVNIEYVMDEELGKNIAVLTWSSSPNVDGHKIRVPYVLKDGVDYRIKVTYKNSGWWCPSYNGAVQGNFGSHDSPSKWQAQYWYITGSGESDYFMLTTNVANLTLQIKDIKIEKMTGITGDLSNDGNVDANDLAMVKRVLLDFMDDDVFMKAGDVNGDGQYTILDFIALKKSITPVPTVVDEAVSVNEVAYASSNIAVDKTGASIFGDSSSFKTAVSGEDAYLIYELRGGITEAAVEYHVSANFMGDFIFEVSRDAKKWTTITANDIAKEEINSNSYVRVPMII